VGHQYQFGVHFDKFPSFLKLKMMHDQQQQQQQVNEFDPQDRSGKRPRVDSPSKVALFDCFEQQQNASNEEVAAAVAPATSAAAPASASAATANKPKKEKKPRAPAAPVLAFRWKKYSIFMYGVLKANGFSNKAIRKVLKFFKVTKDVETQTSFFKDWLSKENVRKTTKQHNIAVNFFKTNGVPISAAPRRSRVQKKSRLNAHPVIDATAAAVMAEEAAVMAGEAAVMAGEAAAVMAEEADVMAAEADVMAEGSDVMAEGADVMAEGSDVMAEGADVMAEEDAVMEEEDEFMEFDLVAFDPLYLEKLPFDDEKEDEVSDFFDIEYVSIQGTEWWVSENGEAYQPEHVARYQLDRSFNLLPYGNVVQGPTGVTVVQS